MRSEGAEREPCGCGLEGEVEAGESCARLLQPQLVEVWEGVAAALLWRSQVSVQWWGVEAERWVREREVRCLSEKVAVEVEA